MWGAPECGLISVQIVPGFCGGSLLAINNRFNALAINAAVSSESGVMQIPSPNYLVPSSFGSLELRRRNGNEFVGQHIDAVGDRPGHPSASGADLTFATNQPSTCKRTSNPKLH